MKIFQVTYDGMWMGGRAIVMAPDAARAEIAVAEDPQTINFGKVYTEELVDLGPLKHLRTKLLYNDNGDY